MAKEGVFWRELNRKVIVIPAGNQCKVSFFVGISRESKEEQTAAIKAAEEFTRPSNLIWIGFREKRWFVVVQAKNREGMIWKIKMIFEKQIFPDMRQRYQELLAKEQKKQMRILVFT